MTWIITANAVGLYKRYSYSIAHTYTRHTESCCVIEYATTTRPHVSGA